MIVVKKLISKTKQAHTSKSQIGMGDYYGTGIKNPMGRMRDGLGMKQLSTKKMKTPPKTWA